MRADLLRKFALFGTVGGLVGCAAPGGAPRIALRQYLDDLAGHHVQAACNRLTHAARRKLEARFDAPCPRALLMLRPVTGAEARAKVDLATVTGDRAVVFVRPFGANPDTPVQVVMRYEDGDWRLAAP